MHRGEARPARRCVYATSTEVTRTTGVATYEARLLLPTYRYGVPWAAQAGYYLPTYVAARRGGAPQTLPTYYLRRTD